MIYQTMSFGRVDTRSESKHVQRTMKQKDHCVKYTGDHRLNRRGHNWEVTIRNNLVGDICKIVSLREPAERLSTDYNCDIIRFDNNINSVVVELEHSRNKSDLSTNATKLLERYTRQYIIKGEVLVNNAFFISELGWYICTPENIDKTLGLLKKEADGPTTDSIIVPFKREDVNSSLIFGDYRDLFAVSIKKMSKLHVHVGHDLRGPESKIPDVIKNLRISVMDRHICPYQDGKMSYDSSLKPDEFRITNLYESVENTPVFSFDALLHSYNGEIYLVDTLCDTMKGQLCEMALFSDDEKLANYFHAHQSEELYSKLENYIVHKEGNPVLRKTIDTLNRTIAEKDVEIEDVTTRNKSLQNDIKELRKNSAELEKTIHKLKNNHDSHMSYDVVMSAIEIDRAKLENEKEKLNQEKYEFEQKRKMTDTAHKASIFKSAADFLKSAWGIILTLVTVVSTIITGYKKLKSSS